MKGLCLFAVFLLPLLNLAAIPFHADSPVIDGDLSDAVWTGLPWRNNFTRIGTTTPAEAQTRFKCCQDGRNLYFAIECDEPGMTKLKTLYAPGSWQNDSVEINLAPDPKLLSFYKLIIDSAGGVQGHRGQDDNTDRGIYVFSPWSSSATVKATTAADKWIVEAAVPIGAMDFNSTDTDHWRLNIGRNRWTVKPPELTSWSVLPEKNHVIPKAFNEVTVEHFSAAEYQYAIEDFRYEIVPEGDSRVCRLSATIHNDTDSFRIFHILCELTDNVTGKMYTGASELHLQANSFQNTVLTIPDVPNGSYRFSWDLKSNRSTADLMKRMSRDLELEYIPLKITLLRPVYRNNLFATMPDKTIEANLELRESVGIPLTAELTGTGVHEVRQVARSTGADTVLFDGAKLPDGTFTLKVTGTDLTGKPLVAETVIRKLPYQKGEVWLDVRGVTHVDGEEFFPYGWYSCHGKREPFYNSVVYNNPWYKDVEAAARTIDRELQTFGVRTLLLPFQELTGAGNTTIFKDPETRRKGLTPEQREMIVKFVSGIRGQDGLLGYYMADEPECRDNNPVWYEEARSLIAELDPYHPCIMLNESIEGIRRYYKGCDILLPDCYPQYFEDGSTGHVRWCNSEYARVAAALRPSWQMLLASCWPDLSRDRKQRGIAPSWHDLRSQAFQALIHNAKGLNFYAWFDSQRFSSVILGVPALGKTLFDIKELILENTVPDGISIVTDPVHPQFQAGLKIHDGQCCILAVNTSMKTLHVSFRLKDSFSGSLFTEGGTKTFTVSNGLFEDDFLPGETKLYFSSPETASRLIASEETEKDIERHRANRKKPGNLIGRGEMFSIDYIRYGKNKELDPGVPVIRVSSEALLWFNTVSGGSLCYLFDGLTEPNRPEYGWRPRDNDKSPWLEIRLSGPAALNEIVLYTPAGNLKAGKIVVGDKVFPFENKIGETEIRIPLEKTVSDLVRIECTAFSYPEQGDEIARRLLLTEVEIYGIEAKETAVKDQISSEKK